MIVRSPRAKIYTVIPNDILEDERLDWAAKGLLCYLLSKPDNWKVSRVHLAAQTPDGKTKVERLLKDLETAGYLERTRVSGPDGKFGWVHVVYDESRLDKKAQVKTIARLTSTGSTSNGSTSNGKPGFLVSTEVTSTEVTKTEEELLSVTFEKFWAAYPRKVGKRPCCAAFNKAVGRTSVEVVMSGIDAALKFWKESGTETQFIPYPSTWLNQDRWADDYKVEGSKLKGNAQLGKNYLPFEYTDGDDMVVKLGGKIFGKGQSVPEPV